MKLNISYPANGSQKLIEIEDERKLRDFMEKRVRFRLFPFHLAANPISINRYDAFSIFNDGKKWKY